MHLVRTYSSKPNARRLSRRPRPSRERKVRKYIQEHLDQPLSLEELAKIAVISPNYFISFFQQSTGMTPHKYVLHQRVEHAKELLATSKLSLIEIAQNAAFPTRASSPLPSADTSASPRSVPTTPLEHRNSQKVK